MDKGRNVAVKVNGIFSSTFYSVKGESESDWDWDWDRRKGKLKAGGLYELRVAFAPAFIVH